ncbi:MAG: rhodanese-like domain-containing protein [Gammaproteobacteria bacterium]|nr:rhodanese-like domain-containing protein [Gammaproteobacteria bacterium]
MTNHVTAVPAAASDTALQYFEARLGFETDYWDVHASLASGGDDFVVLDVRHPELYRAGDVPGTINLPQGKITARKLAEFHDDMLFVVYCAGPHCNGANKAAIRLARLGRPVKEMIGGVTSWADEGFEFAYGDEPGEVVAKTV